MAYLPLLPVQIQRELNLDWNNLLDKYGFTGKHLEWHNSARQNPLTQVGAQQTIDLAKEWFGQVAKAYSRFWRAEGQRCSDLASERFVGWLEEIQNQVEIDVRVLWFDSTTFDPGWRTQWYWRVCEKNVEDSLSLLARGWRIAVREQEKEWLKNEDQRQALNADYAYNWAQGKHNVFG